MTCSSSRRSSLDPLATARADFRKLQHRLAVVQYQAAFLLRAIEDKLVEVDALEHPEVGEALKSILRT